MREQDLLRRQDGDTYLLRHVIAALNRLTGSPWCEGVFLLRTSVFNVLRFLRFSETFLIIYHLWFCHSSSVPTSFFPSFFSFVLSFHSFYASDPHRTPTLSPQPLDIRYYIRWMWQINIVAGVAQRWAPGHSFITDNLNIKAFKTGR